MKKERESLIRKDGFQTLLASLVCILGGLIVGYVVLLIIEPSSAFAIHPARKDFPVPTSPNRSSPIFFRAASSQCST